MIHSGQNPGCCHRSISGTCWNTSTCGVTGKQGSQCLPGDTNACSTVRLLAVPVHVHAAPARSQLCSSSVRYCKADR